MAESQLLARMGQLISAKRQMEGLSLREAQSQSGVSFNTLSRIQSGRQCADRTVAKLELVADWLGVEIVLVAKRKPATGGTT